MDVGLSTKRLGCGKWGDANFSSEALVNGESWWEVTGSSSSKDVMDWEWSHKPWMSIKALKT